MSNQPAHEIWKKVLAVLDEKMQFGFLEMAKEVVDIKISGSEITLFVTNSEAEVYFNSEVNQQRIFIVSRPIHPLSKVCVIVTESSPIQ
ncbi:MAG: hypothetical protein KBC84_07650 [Proteobacteria bacterium]|nr:hypothetical protein [Pseudomonadota bacterium]